MQLNITYRKVEDLIPYVNNSRKHSDQQVAQIAASIKEFGWTNPILVDKDKGIIAGHGRLMAARKLKMDDVPTIELSHLSEAQKKALVIADNKLALNADWDTQILSLELSELQDIGFDLDILGFDANELNALLEPEEVEGLTDEDAVPEVPEEPKTKLGDIYQLGNHRLMCGDSTSIDAVEKLVNKAKIDLCYTDPPYGISFMGKKWDYDVPSVETWKECLRVLKPGGHILVACGTRTQHRMAVNIEDAGFEIRDIVAWIYGSGFPKSLNIGKAINKIDGVEFIAKPASGVGFMNNDKEDGYHPTINQLEQVGESSIRAKDWEGWGTALKPAMELWTMARKPLSEKNIAENVLKWGTGGINIDGSRVIGSRGNGNWKGYLENTLRQEQKLLEQMVKILCLHLYLEVKVQKILKK